MPENKAGLLEEQFGAELGALALDRISVEMSGVDAWVLMTQLQVALRHPALELVAEQGWDRSHDVQMGTRVAVQLADIAVVARLCRVADSAQSVLDHDAEEDLAARLAEAIEAADRSVGRWAAEMEGLES